MSSAAEGLMKLKLTDKQRKFLLELTQGASLTTAYMTAYPNQSESVAHKKAGQIKENLMKRPNVAEWYNRYSKEREWANSKLMTAEYKRETLAEGVKKAKKRGNYGLVVKLIDLDNKMTGVYEKKAKVDGNISLSVGWGDSDGD